MPSGVSAILYHAAFSFLVWGSILLFCVVKEGMIIDT